MERATSLRTPWTEFIRSAPGSRNIAPSDISSFEARLAVGGHVLPDKRWRRGTVEAAVNGNCERRCASWCHNTVWAEAVAVKGQH